LMEKISQMDNPIKKKPYSESALKDV
jgi:hypothetical protein